MMKKSIVILCAMVLVFLVLLRPFNSFATAISHLKGSTTFNVTTDSGMNINWIDTSYGKVRVDVSDATIEEEIYEGNWIPEDGAVHHLSASMEHVSAEIWNGFSVSESDLLANADGSLGIWGGSAVGFYHPVATETFTEVVLDFIVEGTGYITLSFDYNYISEFDTKLEFRQADTAVSHDGYIWNTNNGEPSFFDGDTSFYHEVGTHVVPGPGCFLYEDFGTCSFSEVWFEDGDIGRIYYDIYTRATATTPYNPIPEPTTMLLLGSGLIGLAGFRKKFKK